jgi:AcrR family transcriptional regulator
MIRKRRYTLKRRADNQAETRRRIVEATVDLHTEIGPVHTSISAIAERAGVQRHTVYAHFPTERELALACSGLALERDPLPDEPSWRTIANPEQRLRRGLTEIYAWYARNAELASRVLRDAEVDSLTRDVVRLRIGSRIDALQAVLAQGFRSGRARDAALGLALSFHTWRSLVKDGGLSLDAAVEFVVLAIRCTVEKRK